MAQFENTNLIATSTDSQFANSDHPIIKNKEARAGYLMDISKLKTYVSENLDYPLQAQNNSVEGEVIARLVINEIGKVKSVKIVEGLGFGCDRTVLQMLSEMPDWKPFLRDGKPIAKTLFITINFKMQ
ncbi:MAG: energy transducer TonB [Saprospiraceae bacterium]|nr:energy transducer TonB [Saprospiraceae bacterium]